MVEDPEESDYWVFQDGRPTVWVTSRRPPVYSVPTPKSSPRNLGRQLPEPGPSLEAGARPPCPTPSLETGREGLRQEVWQQPWGKEPGPASVTRFLRDPHPALGRAGSRLGRGTWARTPAQLGVSRTARPPRPPAPAPRRQWFARGAHGDLGGRQFGNGSISLAEGGAPGSGSSSPWQHAGSPHSAGGRGAPRSLPRRPYKGTGRGVASAVPGPGAWSWESGHLPGPRARPGPRRLVPTSPSLRPRAQPRPPGLAPPSHYGAVCCQAQPGPT